MKTSQKIHVSILFGIAGLTIITIDQWLMGAAAIGAALAVWLPDRK